MPEWVLVLVMSMMINGSVKQSVTFHYHDTFYECVSMKQFYHALRVDYDYISCDLRNEWGI